MPTVINKVELQNTNWTLESIEGNLIKNINDPMLTIGERLPYFIISSDNKLDGFFGPLKILGNAKVSGEQIEFMVITPRIWAGDTIMQLLGAFHMVDRYSIDGNILKLYSQDREIATFKETK